MLASTAAGAGLALASLIVFTLLPPVSPGVRVLYYLVQVAAILGLMGAPPVTALYALIFTTTVHSVPQTRLISLTQVPERQIVRVYYRAVLYRLRLMYMLLGGLIPLLVACSLDPRLWDPLLRRTLYDPMAAVNVLVVAAGLLAVNLSAAALGVYAALRWGQATLALIGTPLVWVIASLGLALATARMYLNYLVCPDCYCYGACLSAHAYPLILSAWLLRGAEAWVWAGATRIQDRQP